MKIVIAFRKWVCWLRRDIEQQSVEVATLYMQACRDIYRYSPELRMPVLRTLHAIEDVETFEEDWDWRTGTQFLEPILAEFSIIPLAEQSLLRVLFGFDTCSDDILYSGIVVRAVQVLEPRQYFWDKVMRNRKAHLSASETLHKTQRLRILNEETDT